MSEESNQVKWIGIRPVSEQCVFQAEPGPWAATRGGVARTQIIKQNGAAATTTIVHTVTGGKTLYIASAQLSIMATSTSYGYMLIRDSSDVSVCTALLLHVFTNSGAAVGCAFPMPLSIPAGYDVCMVAYKNAEGNLSIQGWEE